MCVIYLLPKAYSASLTQSELVEWRMLSLISIMTVKHNYLFINLLFLLITGCLYDYMFRSTCDHPQVYKSYYLHVLIVHQYFLKT